MQIGPLAHFASWMAWYFCLAMVVKSLLELTNAAHPQPIAGKVELGEHSSVEPLSQPRAFSRAAA